jgi:hypothetical protein
VQVAEVVLRWWVVGASELCSRASAIYLRCLMELCVVFPALLVRGRDFSVVYNTWRGFFSLYNCNFNCNFLNSTLFNFQLESYVSKCCKKLLGKD